MTISEVLKIDSAFSLVMSEGGLLVIEGSRQKIPMPTLSPGMKAVLEMLFADGATQDDMVRALIQNDGPAAIPQFLMLLQELQRLAVLCRTLYLGDQPCATVVPIGSDGSLPQPRLDPKAYYALSRFVVSRVDAAGIVLESPLSHFQIRLHHRMASQIVFELRTFRSCEDVASEVVDGDVTSVSPFLGMLDRAGMLCRQQEGGGDPEMNSHLLSGWEFHDLLFHSRSRRGRHRTPYGGTFRFVNQFVPSPPALKVAMSEEIIPLDRPDMPHLELSDLSFTAVLEGRRTFRRQGDRPLTRQQLGHFLYRSARVKEVIHTPQGDFSQRPYPAGGALYELEIYPVVARCDGLDSGLYHYGPLDHLLARISGMTPDLARLLEEARYTWDQTEQTQILLIITARFPRVHWKYQSLSYALSLKNLGALYQTMYLVATAMGLAPCALGGGDSDLFARIAGLDYLAEGSIGEFALGSAPTIRPSLISNTSGISSTRRPDASSEGGDMRELELPLPPSLGDDLDLDTIRQAPIRFLEEGVRQCGDIFRYESAGWRAVALNHPTYARHVLLGNAKNFTKLGTPDLMLLKPLLGDGLMTSVGVPWKQQRQMLQPAFGRRQINAYVPHIVDATDALLRRWKQAADTGVPIDLVAEMGRLSLHIVGQCFFGTDMEDEAVEFGQAFANMSAFLAAFDPTNIQGMLHYQQARQIVSTFIGRIVETRRQTGTDNGDILSILLHASDEDGNAALAQRQIQDQVLTLLVGGGETTGQAIGWTLYLLDRHPDMLARVQAEVDAALGGRASFETVEQLDVTWMAIQEAMRLYPPVWLMSRICTVDDVVGRFRIPAGTLVIVSPFILHRHPDFWAEPQVFRPERFRPERIADYVPYAYLPFSGGPRVCIGQAFARMATRLVLAMIVRRFRLQLVPGHPVEPEGTVVTLRPKYGLQVTLHARY